MPTGYTADVGIVMTDYEKLMKAHKVLRDGYADAVAGMRYIRSQFGNLSGVGFDRVDDYFFQNVEMPEREGLLAGSHDIAKDLP